MVEMGFLEITKDVPISLSLRKLQILGALFWGPGAEYQMCLSYYARQLF